MVLSAAGLDDDRCKGGGRERGIDLALGIACCRSLFWQTSRRGWRRCARGGWGRGPLGELRCRLAESDGLSKTGRRSVCADGRLANGRAVVAKRVGANVPRPKRTITALPFIAEVNRRVKGRASSVCCAAHRKKSLRLLRPFHVSKFHSANTHTPFPLVHHSRRLFADPLLWNIDEPPRQRTYE
jgi:hypothetical protein